MTEPTTIPRTDCRVVPVAGVPPLRWRVEQHEDDYKAWREIGFVEFAGGGWVCLTESENELPGSYPLVRGAVVALIERQENMG